ncbi:MAG: hypothetical protein HQL30_08515, partial [Candidatus Omnitrophica bacterium]|nr:hypothetical protein [Candidatus Omnitrophota bacterium]
GVYKLSVFDGEERLKLSNTLLKTSNPVAKNVVAIIAALGRVVKRMTVMEGETFDLADGEEARALLKPVVSKGEVIYDAPRTMQELYSSSLFDRHIYKDTPLADLSEKLAEKKTKLITRAHEMQPGTAHEQETRSAKELFGENPLFEEGKELVAVFDVYGVLLESTWKDEYKDAYRELVGVYPEKEWVEKFVMNKTSGEVIQAISVFTGKTIKEVQLALKKVRKKRQEERVPERVPMAFDFIRSLKRAGVKIVVTCGGNKKQVLEQLGKRGYLDYIDKKDVFSVKESDPLTYNKDQVLGEVAKKFPYSQMAYFDDWMEGIRTVRASGGVMIGVTEGRGKELAVNKQRLISAGVDLALLGWEGWENIYQMMAAHTREVKAKSLRNGYVARSLSPESFLHERYFVSDRDAPWDKELPGYNPSHELSGEVLANAYDLPSGKKYADRIDYQKMLKDIDEGKREPFTSYEGEVKFDPLTKLPLNPKGRTGVWDRGELAKYGANHASDAVVTRVNTDTGKLEVLLIKRRDNGRWAIPGGFRNRGLVGGIMVMEDPLAGAI